MRARRSIRHALSRSVALAAATVTLSAGMQATLVAAPASAETAAAAATGTAAPAGDQGHDHEHDHVQVTLPGGQKVTVEKPPALDMAGWYAVPVLRERTDGKAGVPAVEVIDLPAYGLGLADLAARGIPALPFARLAEWTDARILASGVPSGVVDDLLAPRESASFAAMSTSSIPAGTLPLSVYYDGSQMANGRSDVDQAWAHAVSFYQDKHAIPIHRVRLLTGSQVPIHDVSTFCHMQTLARYEMDTFVEEGRALVIFSAGGVEGTDGVAIGGNVSHTYARGESKSYCPGDVWLTPAVIPSAYISGFWNTGIFTVIDDDKTGIAYTAAHEIGHLLSADHPMARCWTDSSAFHNHKTLEAWTSADDTPDECGANFNPTSHYHWYLNDQPNKGVDAVNREWAFYKDCQALQWCPNFAAPSKVPSLTATPGPGKVTLSWGTPAHNGGANPTGYCYVVTTSTSTVTGTETCVSGTSAIVTGLPYNQTRYFYVRAHNAYGKGPRSDFTSGYAQDPNDLTSTDLTTFPSSVAANSSFQVCWVVNGGGSISHTDLHWGTTTSLGSTTPTQTGTAPGNFCATLTAPSSGTVYVQSHAQGPNDNLASLIASIPVQVSHNDCHSGVDAGGSFGSATSISLPKTNCGGNLTSLSDTEDWYSFSVTSGQTITASMTPNANADFDICLVNPSGTQVGSCTAGSNGTTDSISHVATTSGSYRLRVYIYGGTGSYTMSLSAATPQNDCGVGGDAGNSHATASSISLPKTNCSGTLVAQDDDFYQFSVTSGQAITASMTPNASSDFDICLYEPNGATIGSCTTGSAGSTDTLNHTATVTGSYRLRVMIWNGTGSYTMSVSTGSGPVTIRYDDNDRDTAIPVNYDDETVVKRLDVTSAQRSGKTTATLHVYGKSNSCTQSGNKYRLRVNTNVITDLNPCSDWSSSAYSWKAYSVPLSYVNVGTNSFDIKHIAGGGDWNSRNVEFGIDSESEYQRSDTVYDGIEVHGELMWYLVLS